MRLKDKVTIVTGGNGDIGYAIAETLGVNGSSIVIADLDSNKGEEAISKLHLKGIEAIFVKTDVSNEEEVRNLIWTSVDRFGYLTGLINNAGVPHRKSVLEISLEEWKKVFAVNLEGPFLCSKYAIPEMEKSGGGSIVNISSWLAEKHMTRTAAYSASKGGLLSLTRQMALDCAALNVRVNAVCPSSVDTPMFRQLIDALPDPQDGLKQYLSFQPFGRIGTVEDIANACLFMISDEASYVSGQTLMIDGAASMKIARPLQFD